MEAELVAKVEQWLQFDKNDVTRSEILRFKEANDRGQLARLLLGRMEFGTAGLRAPMGPGNNQLNDLTIIQTTQGLLKYATLQFKDLKSSGIIVGFDGRHNSKKWAHYVANIFMNAGCIVYLFRECYPTPMLAFGVRHYKTALGVMITASHNPKEDNGYKVYWCNGSQIISPHDRGIAACIEENLDATRVFLGNWFGREQFSLSQPITRTDRNVLSIAERTDVLHSVSFTFYFG
ncbi:hypothetical protein AHF37_08284 [Paragonimus kellicotti]|nr:hypothetical protein AHF37_08284 [Paragonimus kellicotti]